MARLLRDAQVNTIWEGPDNILCLDVRRGIERAQAHEPLLQRLHDAVSVSDDDDTTGMVSRRVEDLGAAVTAWTKLDGAVAEARLFPLAQFMGDVYAGALLIEQAAWGAGRRSDGPQGARRSALRAALSDRSRAASRHRRRGRRGDRAFRRARGGCVGGHLARRGRLPEQTGLALRNVLEHLDLARRQAGNGASTVLSAPSGWHRYISLNPPIDCGLGGEFRCVAAAGVRAWLSARPRCRVVPLGLSSRGWLGVCC